jgi:succinyl-CoA synthetase beta subunit/citryl-CoA synthetase large subunit
MRLLEHQSRKLLEEFGLRFTDAVVVETPDAAAKEAQTLGLPVMIKAQVPFGGRGKAGAVLSADTPEDAAAAADQLLGRQLRGVTVTRLSVEKKVSFLREFYVGVTWDTASKLPVALLGPSGGVDVEQATAQIARQTFDPWTGLACYQGREMAARAGLSGKTLVVVGDVFNRLARAFLDRDAVLAEVNPLVEIAPGQILCLDAHVEIEDDAAYRQQAQLEPLGEIFTTTTGRTPTSLELEAQRIDSMDHRGVAGRVVEFDGDLALLIGGGGASLTVFDAILHHGGKPANYCEIGGNPTAVKVAALTRLLLSKPEVKRLAVIMNVVNNTRADVIARGVLDGVESAGQKASEIISLFRVPGSWEDEARDIMATAGVASCGREISLDRCAQLVAKGDSSGVT